jgi:hypothetical protein
MMNEEEIKKLILKLKRQKKRHETNAAKPQYEEGFELDGAYECELQINILYEVLGE